MQKTFEGLLGEYRQEVQAAIPAVRARVAGSRQLLELKLQVGGADPNLSAERWGHLAHIGTLDKLGLILQGEREYNTFELLATARNIFENLVWVRFLNRDFRRGLISYGKFLQDEIQSINSYIQKITDEAELFDAAGELDTHGLMSTIGEVLDDEPDSSAVSSARDKHKELTEVLDDMVRREFSLYGNSAVFNGYEYQAHILREKILPEMEGRLIEAQAQEAKLRSHLSANYPEEVTKLLDQKWNWGNWAEALAMRKHYNFIYRLTSRLLHSGPLNIMTEKSLTEPEKLLVMDYHVVAGADLLTEIDKFSYPGKSNTVLVKI